jgi:hypothetical protein
MALRSPRSTSPDFGSRRIEAANSEIITFVEKLLHAEIMNFKNFRTLHKEKFLDVIDRMRCRTAGFANSFLDGFRSVLLLRSGCRCRGAFFRIDPSRQIRSFSAPSIARSDL